jgi:NAD(P)-dependent dehydrogenase (short-subunit alcohol dehydrogenase family)
MSIGIVGAGNMGRSIATQLAKTGKGVTLADRNPGKAEAVVAEIAGDGVSVPRPCRMRSHRTSSCSRSGTRARPTSPASTPPSWTEDRRRHQQSGRRVMDPARDRSVDELGRAAG